MIRLYARLALLLALAGPAHGGALHYFDTPFASLIDIDFQAMDPLPAGPVDIARFGPFAVTAADAETSLIVSSTRLQVSGSLDITPEEPSTGFMILTGSQMLRVRGFGIDGALLFDETGPGNVRGFDHPRGKLLILSATPLAAVRLDPASDSATYTLGGFWSITPDEIGPFFEAPNGQGQPRRPLALEVAPVGSPGDTRPDGLVPDPANGNILYAVSPDGTLSRTDDGGVVWRALPSPWTAADRLVVHPSGSNHLWMLDGETLWQSADRGERWSNTALSDVEAIDIVEDSRTGEANPGINRTGGPTGFRFATAVYVAAGGTLFVSEDFGASYRPIAPLPGRVEHIEVYDGTVFSGQTTDGRMHMSTDQGRSWSADPAWGSIRPDQIVFTPCGDLARAGEQLYARPDTAGVRAPALPVRAPVIDLTRSSTYGCETLLSTDQGWWRFRGFDHAFNPGICRSIPFCPPESLVFEPLLIPDDAYPVRHSARLTGFYESLPDAEFVVVQDDVLHRADRSSLAIAPDIDRYRFVARSRDFYPVEIVLPDGEDAGFWGATLFSELSGGINVGATLPASGEAPGFLAFALTVPGPVDIRVFEYTGQIAELEVRLLRQDEDSRTPIGNPTILGSGDGIRFEDLAPDALHILELRSSPGDPAGRYGVELLATALRDGASFGGSISAGEIGGFFGVFMDTGDNLLLDVAYGENYGTGGAGAVVPEFLGDQGAIVADQPGRLSLDGLNQRVSSEDTSAAFDRGSGAVLVLDQGLGYRVGADGTQRTRLEAEEFDRVLTYTEVDDRALLATFFPRFGILTDTVSLQLDRLKIVDVAPFESPSSRSETITIVPPQPVLSLPEREPRVSVSDGITVITVDGIREISENGRLRSEYVAYRYERASDAWTTVGTRTDQPVVAATTPDGAAVLVATAADTGAAIEVTVLDRTGMATGETIPVALEEGQFPVVFDIATANSTEAILGVAAYTGPNFLGGVPRGTRLDRYPAGVGTLEDLGTGDAPLVTSDGRSVLFERPALAYPEPGLIEGGRQLFWMTLDGSGPIAVSPPLANLTSRALSGETVLFVSSDPLAEFDNNGDDVSLWTPPTVSTGRKR
ncbi:MAG: hypothetical protein AAGE01_18190 [Pseudomonadota bacterium]